MVTPGDTEVSSTANSTTNNTVAHTCCTWDESVLDPTELVKLREIKDTELATRKAYFDSFQSCRDDIINAAKKTFDDTTFIRKQMVDTLYKEIANTCEECKKNPGSVRICEIVNLC